MRTSLASTQPASNSKEDMCAQRVFCRPHLTHAWNELHQLRWHATHQRLCCDHHNDAFPVFLKTRDHRLCGLWLTRDQIQQNSNLPTVCDTTSRESITLPSSRLDANRQEYKKGDVHAGDNSGMSSSQSFAVETRWKHILM